MYIFQRLSRTLFAMTALVVATSASAKFYDFEVAGLFYSINEGGTTVTLSHNGEGIYDSDYTGDIVIPAEVSYDGKTYTVTAIGEYAFYGCVDVSSVKMPETITKIGDFALYYCYGLSEVEIPGSVTEICQSAISFCRGLTSLTIPNSVTVIGEMAFMNCDNLVSIEIGNSVETISSCAVAHCYKLKSIHIPASVSFIGEDQFERCDCLESITVDADNPIYDSRDNCNAIIETATNTLIGACNKSFIPGTVTTIGSYAFCGCASMTSIEIPNSVTTIREYSFWDCNSLETLNIPSSVTLIETHTFGLLNSLKAITVDADNSVYDSRRNCNAIIESSSNRLIVGSQSTTFPDDIVSIGEAAFFGCSGLESVALPSTVTAVESRAFTGCRGITTVDLGTSVETIGDAAFGSCAGLTAIEIPASVNSLGVRVFYGCVGLQKVTSANPVPPVANENTFMTIPETCVLYVPEGSIGAYQAATGWDYFSDVKSMEEGIASIALNNIKVRLVGDIISIEGAPDGAEVQIYDVGGRCIYRGTARQVPVAQRGIYLIKVAGHIIKI